MTLRNPATHTAPDPVPTSARVRGWLPVPRASGRRSGPVLTKRVRATGWQRLVLRLLRVRQAGWESGVLQQLPLLQVLRVLRVPQVLSLLRLLLLFAWPLHGALAVAAEPASECNAVEPVPWQPVVPGVWVWLPPGRGDVSPANAGHVVPTSVVVGGGEALVIDPGPSQRHGERLRRSIECRFGAQVRWIVNTHAHAENVLANSAFADRVAAGLTEVLASAPTREGMALRCTDCLAGLTHRAGELAMAGTRIVLPTGSLRAGDTLRVGGLRLRVMRLESGHTEGDLVLWNRRHRVLWAGGLVYQDRLPELAQGRVDDWLAALQRLQALRPRHVLSTVWSVGREGTAPPALHATGDYLSALRQRTMQAMDQGAAPQDTAQVALPAFRGWEGYAERHEFNVQRAWRELEPVWMDRAAPAR